MRGKIAVAATHKTHHPVGAGQAPPATVYYNEYNGLACRGGIYAARCSHPDITNYRVNRPERSRPFRAILRRLQYYGLVCIATPGDIPLIRCVPRHLPPKGEGFFGGVTPSYIAINKTTTP